MTARARQAIPARQDDRLAELYRNVTEQQVARFSAGYDLPAGQGRYAGWLRQQGTDAGDGGADRAVTELYGQHYRALVRFAALLVHDVPAAEELVQDSFVDMHSAWPKLTGHDDAVSFLQRSVVQGSRAPRYHLTMAATAPEPAPDVPTAAGPPRDSAVITALRALPDRQREAVVLRCCTDLADGQIAAAMGTGTGEVRDHATHAMSALRDALQADGGALQIGPGEPG